MNFDFDEQQQAVADLAEQIFAGQTSDERIKIAERSGDFDRRLWSELAGADLVGLCLPEPAGGSNAGIVELAITCQAQGRHVAPAPLLCTVATALAIASADAGHPSLHGVVGGDTVLTTAFGGSGVAAETAGRSFRLRGECPAVPYGQWANHVLVAAGRGSDVGLFVVPADSLHAEPVATTDRQPAANLTLDTQLDAGARIGGVEEVAHLRQHWLVGQASTVVGLAEGALAATAQYVSSRTQFGRPLAAFQAVGQRAADAYITTEALRVTTLSAAWQLDHGDDKERIASDVLIAAYWASQGGQDITLATQHLHGGMGADVDYPIHRYFLWATQLANALGTASSHLAELGRLIAEGARR